MDKHLQFLQAAREGGYALAYESVYGPVPDAKAFVLSLHALGLGSTTIAPLMQMAYGYGSKATVERIVNPGRSIGVERHKQLQIDLMKSTARFLYAKGLTKATAKSILCQRFDTRAMYPFSRFWDSQ